MPVITRAHALPLDADLRQRMQKFEPEVPLVPLDSGATLYIGWFNDKPVAGAWACGDTQGRQLLYFGIHPATRGRGVLQRLAHDMRELENASGRRVLSAQDYSALDS
jgi:hypothetical protein